MLHSAARHSPPGALGMRLVDTPLEPQEEAARNDGEPCMPTTADVDQDAMSSSWWHGKHSGIKQNLSTGSHGPSSAEHGYSKLETRPSAHCDWPPVNATIVSAFFTVPTYNKAPCPNLLPFTQALCQLATLCCFHSILHSHSFTGPKQSALFACHFLPFYHLTLLCNSSNFILIVFCWPTDDFPL
jgi:hypothetical protein